MKNYVLAFLLFLFPGLGFAQETSPRQIVKASLRKMTGGKQLQSFQLKYTYEKPKPIPSELAQPDPFSALLDSIMKTLPDSSKKVMKAGMQSANERGLQNVASIYSGVVRFVLFDMKEKKAATLSVRPNSFSKETDTTRVVFGLNDPHFLLHYKQNPIVLLQLMILDSVDVHYTGTSLIDHEEHHMVQVRIGKIWLDTYINKKTLLLSRTAESKVDRDPLLGKGPEHYKDYVIYSDYRNQNGFLLPASMQEISSRSHWAIPANLQWTNINGSFPVGSFAPEPSYEEKTKFEILDLEEDLFVVDRSTPRSHHRTIARRSDDKIDFFGNMANFQKPNTRLLEMLEKKFPGSKVGNVFFIEPVSFVSPFVPMFAKSTNLILPKGNGYNSDEQLRRFNSSGDSIWKAMTKTGQLKTFTNSFAQGDVRAFVLNPVPENENDQRQVFYYFKKYKAIYATGFPYLKTAEYTHTARPSEREMLQFITSEKLPVDYIIFSEAFSNDLPVKTTFEDFQNRVRSTDFSGFDRRK